MGNSLCGNGLYCNHVKLGSDGAIDMTEEEVKEEDDGGYSQGWTVSYTTYVSGCTLHLGKVVDKRDRVRQVFLELEDDICFGGGIRIWINRAQKINFLKVDYRCGLRFRDMMLSKTNDTSMKTTKVFYYGRGSTRGLVVVEWKKKSKDDENPYRVTVAHYYAVSTAPANSSRIDIGLSMVVNIRVSNSNLDFKVEGPVQHTSSALFYMFEQVYRSGTWNPTACPHCAPAHQRQQRSVVSSGQSDAESARLLPGPRQIGGSILSNAGVARGNYNGSLFMNNSLIVNT